MSNILPGFSFEDSETIGFVTTCVFASAIDISELRDWCVHVIDQNDVESIPSYLFDLMDFDQPLSHLYRVIGFAPGWEHTGDEYNALYGIAVLRGRERYDPPIRKQEALDLLRKNPLIAKRFNQIFPFISLPNDSENS